MKLVTYKQKGKPSSLRVGFIEGNKIVDLQEAYIEYKGNTVEAKQLLPSDPSAFYQIGHSVIERAKAAYSYVKENGMEGFFLDREEVYLSTPNPTPQKIICVGKNYAEHAAEMDSDIPDYPVLFAKYPNALVGPDDNMVKSSFTQKMDYEVELTVVIGKEAKDVPKENALDYIAGYTIGNDGTARDLQKRTPQWLQGKNLDLSTPIGPWIVTADEVGDPGNLTIQSYVNGEMRQSSTTNKLIFDVPYLVEFISQLMTLKPGDMIMTGTPDGVGFGMNPQQFLQNGDNVTLEIEKIGKMDNKVIEK
ncbi:acylpyruvate hydrolase [Oceanobacillus limi]|uniref:Acylpyruvate hydrolase n=1 Tax=Oceanobacillus limi TaxID=930131 RepID=A0A1I0F8H0_9BACI|nr:fumarylacetoacetate hydrolase family protein [Oceanobacillus limi]SET54078.1 acylpyruvate hydrolase [Oceanobacillus limi]